MAPIPVGTLVLIVNTDSELDGATGIVAQGEHLNVGPCLRCGLRHQVRVYGIDLPRPILGVKKWGVERPNLRPMTPPGPVDQVSKDEPVKKPEWVPV